MPFGIDKRADFLFITEQHSLIRYQVRDNRHGEAAED
jgi:hypothetical protein